MYKSYKITVYRKQGKTNEKIVFIHGGALDNAMMSWKEVIELMENDYDIYAIDMLGFGESDKPDIVYCIPTFVELLHDALGQLRIERTNLVGLSMGGGISIAFSLKYPQMMNKLTIVDTMGLYSKMPYFHSFCRWYVNSKFNDKSNEWFGKSKRLVKLGITSVMFGDKNRVSDELVDDLYNLVHEPDSGKAWESFQRYEIGKKKLTTDLTSHLSELTMPVLIVNGEKDSAVPVKFAVAANKVIKNSKLHIMKECKHWCQKEKPEEFVQVLKEFLLK